MSREKSELHKPWVTDGDLVNVISIYRVHDDQIRIRVMVFNATFNNVSAISWRSVLLVEEMEVSGGNHCYIFDRGRRGRNHMVVGFITTYGISVYHN
jgi:hypothetical protein